MSNNPLEEYFRVPALHLELPSKGKWYSENSIDLPENGEVEVYPMTAKDDIILQTPDALMNGKATTDVIESCIPQIKNGMDVPSIDLDSILLAIRIATYGSQLDITSTCPECSEINDYAIDLSDILSKINCPDFDTPITRGKLELFLKPQTYRTINKRNLERFEEQRIIAATENSSMSDEDKIAEFNRIMVKIASITVEQLADSIDHIMIDGTTKVDDANNIIDFLNNCEKSLYDTIKSKTSEVKKQSDDLTNVNLTCDDCGHQYETTIELEFSNFFG